MSHAILGEVRGKRALLLGANGYLGRHLTHYLAKAGCAVRACDMQPEGACPVPAGEYLQLDVTRLEALQVIDWDVDFVFVFAGMTGTHAGFEQFNRFVQVNELGLLNVLTAILGSGHRPRIVFPSTRLVYAGSELSLPEDAPKQPKTIYAVNKLACEHILESYRHAFDLPFTIFRICVPYGNSVGNGYSYGLTGTFIKQARENSAITLYGDGSLRRTLSHIDDICRDVIALAADPRGVGEIFNVPGEPFSLLAVATAIAARYGARVDYRDWPAKDLKIESGHTVFDGSKLRSLFDRSPDQHFESWIRQAPDL